MLASNTLLRNTISTNDSHEVAPQPEIRYEGKIIHFSGAHGETVENTEITKFLRSLLQSDNLPGGAMTEPTREEIDAKLATVEARDETRFVELSNKIDRVADAIGTLTSAVTTVRTEVREDFKFTRWTVAESWLGLFEQPVGCG